MNQRPSSQQTPSSNRPFLWFARLWATSAIVQQVTYLAGPIEYWSHGRMGSPFGALIMMSAITLLFTRQSVWPLGIYALLQVSQCLANMPLIPNHVMLEGSINVSILLAIAVATLRSSGRTPSPATVFGLFAPAARLQILVLYLLAVLHKLNWDFFDPEVSCVPQLLGDIGEKIPIPQGPTVAMAMIIGTVVVEAAIPVLFIFKRTRLLGIVVALAFHVPLSIHSLTIVASFTTFLLPCFFLFAPTTLSLGADQLETTLARKTRIPHGISTCLQVILIAAIAWAALHALGIELSWFRRVLFCADLLVIGVITAWFLLTIARVWISRPAAPERIPHALRPIPLLWAMPVLLTINALLPYLGAKTELTFSMYSNLRVEGEHQNHMFVPPSFKVFPHQDDLVEILSSTIPWINGRGVAGQLLNHHELRRRVQRAAPPWNVAYLRNGTRHTAALDETSNYEGDPALIEPLTWWEETFITYRIVEKDGPMRCRH